MFVGSIMGRMGFFFFFFYVGGDLMTRRGMLPIMLPDGDFAYCVALSDVLNFDYFGECSH